MNKTAKRNFGAKRTKFNTNCAHSIRLQLFILPRINDTGHKKGLRVDLVPIILHVRLVAYYFGNGATTRLQSHGVPKTSDSTYKGQFVLNQSNAVYGEE